jgi:hypothetical protein
MNGSLRLTTLRSQQPAPPRPHFPPMILWIRSYARDATRPSRASGRLQAWRGRSSVCPPPLRLKISRRKTLTTIRLRTLTTGWSFVTAFTRSAVTSLIWTANQRPVDEKQIDYVMGSGSHARTYLHRTAAGIWHATQSASFVCLPDATRAANPRAAVWRVRHAALYLSAAGFRAMLWSVWIMG